MIFSDFLFVLNYTHKTPCPDNDNLANNYVLLLPSAVVIYYCELSNSHKHYDSGLLVLCY